MFKIVEEIKVTRVEHRCKGGESRYMATTFINRPNLIDWGPTAPRFCHHCGEAMPLTLDEIKP